jgi:hypothetical protein
VSSAWQKGKDKLYTAGKKPARFPYNEMFGIFYGKEGGETR